MAYIKLSQARGGNWAPQEVVEDNEMQCCRSRSAWIRLDPHLKSPPGSGSGSAWTDADPDLHGQVRIRIQEVKKPRKCTSSWGEYITGRSKVGILL